MKIKLKDIPVAELSSKDKEEILFWNSTASTSLVFEKKKKIAETTCENIKHIIIEKNNEIKLTVLFSEHLNNNFEGFNKNDFFLSLLTMKNIFNSSQLKEIEVTYSLSDVAFRFSFDFKVSEQSLNKMGTESLNDILSYKVSFYNVSGVRKNLDKDSGFKIINMVFDMNYGKTNSESLERSVRGVREYEA